MNTVKSFFACCLAATLTASGTAQAPSFSDNFEGATLDPFWTPSVTSGSITFPSTVRFHGGRQAVQFHSINTSSNKYIYLTHTFAQPTYGCVSVWVYDTGANLSSSNYIALNVGNGGYVTTFDYDLGANNGGNYYYGIPSNAGSINSGVDRTQAWHQFSISSTATALTIAIDGVTVFSGPGGTPMPFVQLAMSGPNWRPAWETSFDDFSFTAPAPSTYALFGAGCTGSNGTPTINPPATTPRIGASLNVMISSLPITSAAFGILGLSNTRLGNGTPLPLPLAAFGMPGCRLLVSDEAIQFLGNRPTPTTALWTLPIPMDVHLLGASFFQQVLVTDPGINALGVTGSNAGRGTIGDC